MAFLRHKAAPLGQHWRCYTISQYSSCSIKGLNLASWSGGHLHLEAISCPEIRLWLLMRLIFPTDRWKMKCQVGQRLVLLMGISPVSLLTVSNARYPILTKRRIWRLAMLIWETALRSCAGKWRSDVARHAPSLQVSAEAGPAGLFRSIEARAFHLQLEAALLISFAWDRTPPTLELTGTETW